MRTTPTQRAPRPGEVVDGITNLREHFTPATTRRGGVVHLTSEFEGCDWRHVVCGHSGRGMTQTRVDDPRPTCRRCIGPDAVERAVSFGQYMERPGRRRTEAVDLDNTMGEIEALAESIKEKLRRRDIRRGVDPDRPRETIEQIRAETVALRAQNDQELAEMRGAWRTHD